MNKRARLARRILREHRRVVFLHVTREFGQPPLEVWGFWTCPHCIGAGPHSPEVVPVAYR